MRELQERIKKEGIVLPNNVLKVNTFLNHGVDVLLLKRAAEKFAAHFVAKKVTKVLTAETSGIAPATLVALQLGVPLVFARKKKSSTLKDDVYAAVAHSYTKGDNNTLVVQKNLLQKTERVLIIDDFLANGQATLALAAICQQAQANVVGAGFMVEKSFQVGAKTLKQQGIDVLSLARIRSLKNGTVEFEED